MGRHCPKLAGRRVQQTSMSAMQMIRVLPAGLGGRAVWWVAGVLMLAFPVLSHGAGLPVVFSEVGGAFTNEFSLELRAKAKGAVVRFTLDGSEPNGESTRYTEAIPITNSLQVRARAFDRSGTGSEVVSHAYFLLAPELWEFDSNLPLAILGSFGQEIEREEKIPGVLYVSGGEGEKRVSLRGPVEMGTRVLVNQRGRASTRYPKHSYTIKLIDETDDFRNLAILGMPKDADWILYAPYPDKTLMRDVLAYELSNQIGRWAPRTRFIELFVLERPGKLTREDYVGVYVLAERVKRDANRVDITSLQPDDNGGEAVTGGYIFKKDHSDRNMPPAIAQGYPAFEASTSSKTGYPTGPGAFPADPAGFLPPYRGRTTSTSTSSRSTSSSSRPKTSIVTNIVGAPMAPKKETTVTRSIMYDEDGNEMILVDEEDASIDTSFKTTVLTNRFYYVDPEPDEITGVQRAWLMNHLEDTERAIAGVDFKSSATGYAAFIDVNSFIDYHWLVELTKNVDGFRFSTFYHMDRGGKIKMGPLWDWNLSFGNCNGKQGYMPDRWLWPQLDDREYTWFRRLFEDPDFGQKFVDRWTELRATVFAETNLLGRVDGMARYLDESQKRNFERWPILGVTVNPNWFVADTYGEEVAWMKDWIAKRVMWIDAQFVTVPNAARDGAGLVSLEPGTEIYFTRDGSDPRTSGGGVSSQATKYSEPFSMKGSEELFARARAGSRWSGPRIIKPAVLTRR